jgi:hypothetical protein
VEIEDTPFVVREIDGDPEHGFRVTLNDDTVEPLDLRSLRAGTDHAFYCRVKNRQFEARLLRSPYYQLARWVAATPEGAFVLRCREGDYAIQAR